MHFAWTTNWPHALPSLRGALTTDDPQRVTCAACLWALGVMQETAEPVQPVTADVVKDIVSQTRNAFSDLADYADAETERANLAESRLRAVEAELPKTFTGLSSDQYVSVDKIRAALEAES